MRDSFSRIERPFVEPYRRGFAAVSAPVVRALVWLGVPPNAVSAAQVLVAVLIVAIMGSAPAIAFVLFLSTLLLDSLDGAVARASGKMSAFGALVDQICDHTRESLVIAAVAVQGALHPFPAVLYPLIYTLFNFLLYLCNREGVPVPWAIKSYVIVYPALFLYTCFGVGWFTPAVMVSEGLMAVTILIALSNLRQVLGGGATAPSPPGSP